VRRSLAVNTEKLVFQPCHFIRKERRLKAVFMEGFGPQTAEERKQVRILHTENSLILERL
jgi:hypothetical protein